MATLSRRVGGSDDYPIYRVTETRADGTLAITFELHGPRGLQQTFSTWSHAQGFLDASSPASLAEARES